MSPSDLAIPDAVAIASELPPPSEPVRKDKKWRKHPRPGALTKRPPPRPHKRIPDETLRERIKKLTSRMDRARKQVSRPPTPHCVSPVTYADPSCSLLQHDDARRLLTKYSHEETYRLRESIQDANASVVEAAAPLPEFEEIQSAHIPPPPAALP